MIREDLMGAPVPTLQLQRAQDAVGVRGLRVPWQRLWARASENPFLSWSWMEAAWTHLDPHRRPLVISAHTADGELVGLLPLSVQRVGVARVARFLADDTVGSDYLEALVDPALGATVRRALWGEALRLRGAAYDSLELDDLDGAGATAGEVTTWGRSLGLAVRSEPRYRCPRILISGSFDAYLKRVARAENLRRRQRQLERTPGFAIDVARTEAEVRRALPTFFALHRARWAREGGSQGIPGPRVERFHAEVSARLARLGCAQLYTLRVGAAPLASVYMLGVGGTRYFYQSGYDPGASHQSPGRVLLARTISDAFAQGAHTYDFLRGSESYKFEWSNDERQTVALRAVVPTFRGRWRAGEQAALRAARRWARQALGEAGYGALRDARASTRHRLATLRDAARWPRDG